MIHDIAFNEANGELVVIASNGEIIYCHEKYCRYHSNLEIITNFNVDAYDLAGCICDDEVRKQLMQNGALEGTVSLYFTIKSKPLLCGSKFHFWRRIMIGLYDCKKCADSI